MGVPFEQVFQEAGGRIGALFRVSSWKAPAGELFYGGTYVGLSNILDSELFERKPSKGPHREVVGAAVMDNKLFGKVVQRVKAVAGIETLLVLPMAALHFAVVARSVGADEFVSDAQRGSGGLKQRGKIPLAVGETVCELKAIVRLDAFHVDAPSGIPLNQLFQEVCGGVGTLLWIGSQKAQARKLIHGGVLKQAQLRISDTLAGHHFHIHLDSLAGIGHLLVRLGFVCFFLLRCRKQSQLPHDSKQALWQAGIASLPQTVPQLHHTQVWIAAAHIAD